MTDQPTRMIFAARLTPGAVIVDDCYGGGQQGCSEQISTTAHRHQLTVLDMMPNGENVEAIVVQEDGEQRAWSLKGCIPIRIIAV